MTHEDYIKRRERDCPFCCDNPCNSKYPCGNCEAIDELVLALVASAKPAEYQAESWQQGLEKKAFDDAVRVYGYKITTIVKGGENVVQK